MGDGGVCTVKTGDPVNYLLTMSYPTHNPAYFSVIDGVIMSTWRHFLPYLRSNRHNYGVLLTVLPPLRHQLTSLVTTLCPFQKLGNPHFVCAPKGRVSFTHVVHEYRAELLSFLACDCPPSVGCHTEFIKNSKVSHLVQLSNSASLLRTVLTSQRCWARLPITVITLLHTHLKPA